jgi:hypothetical protein
MFYACAEWTACITGNDGFQFDKLGMVLDPLRGV